MNILWQDVIYGLRVLRRNPGFTTVAALALALGIASTTSIFSVVDRVLLHPLPYPEPGRIVYVAPTDRETGATTDATSPANYLDWVAQNKVFSQIAAGRGWQANLSTGDTPERIHVAMVTANFFPLFGVSPLKGRPLLEDDDQAGHNHVAVLGYGIWKRRFSSDPDILNKDITLDGQPYTVVGIMPPDFAPDGYGELWLPSQWGVPSHPLAINDDPRPMRDRNYLDVWARVKPGVTLAQARSDMNGIGSRLSAQYPDSNSNRGIGLTPLEDYVVGDVQPMLLVLLGAVGFVLLIGCANVANLLLARATTRSREISVRSAMGAGRWRLIRQLLTESVLLAAIGGSLGVLLAVWAIPALLALSPPEIRGFSHVGINKEVLGFSLALSLLSGLFFGLAPAVQASRTSLNASLKKGERGSTGRTGSTRSALIVAEIGLSVVLLSGAGLMVKSFARLLRVDPGFDASHLLVFNAGLPASSTPQQQEAFYRQIIERLQAVPGVQSAGAVSRVPLSGGNSSRSFSIPGSDRKDHEADLRISSPDYFRAMKIPLLAGRNFSDHDVEGSERVAIVNEAFAKEFFPGQDLIGKYFTDFGPANQKLEIIGVVGNVRHTALETAPRPEAYLPFGQGHWPSVFVALRTASSDPTSITSAAQNAVWSVNRSIPLAGVRTMESLVSASMLQRKFTMLLLAIFAGLALLLAAIGIYGVMSYAVSQRTHEIGIRMALGAQRGDVLKLMVGPGMRLAGGGVLLGVATSLALNRLIAGLLFGVSATDPATFVLVALGLCGTALLANYVPARRAAKVDPMVALRYE